MYKTGDKQLIKNINKTSILRVIQTEENVSRADIARKLKLTSATVCSNVSELIEKKIVKEVGVGESKTGRKPMYLAINGEGACSIGVYIYKDGVQAAVVNLLGTVIAQKDLPLICGKINLEQAVIECINSVIRHVKDRQVIGIGIGMHGIIDTDRNISVFAPAMNLRNYDLKSYIEKQYHLPVFIENDANAMAIGESWYGRAKDIDNYVFIDVGRGIGAGIVINGNIFHGISSAAGEIGHIKVMDNGIQCVCGKYGCLDTVATEYSLIREIKKRLELGKNSVLTRYLQGNFENLTMEEIYDAAKVRDQLVIEALKNIGEYIGIAASYIVNILNPEMVLLGGDMVRLGEFILPTMDKTIQNLSLKESYDNTKVELSRIKRNAGVIGAASLSLQNTIRINH